MVITSRANEKIKSLRALKNRRERDARGVFFAEGLRVLRAALDTGAQIEEAIVASARLEPAEADVVEELASRHVPLIDVSDHVYDSISFREEAESLGAVIRQRTEPLTPDIEARRCFVVLHDIQHPGNLGTIIRTVDAIGGDGVILSGRTTDPYHPIAVRGSLGAIFSQRILRAGFDELRVWLAAHDYAVVGTSPSADVEYRDADYRRPVVLIGGNERVGITPEHQELCDTLVRVPMLGLVDSLNLSVATALVLYEIQRQQDAASNLAAHTT